MTSKVNTAGQMTVWLRGLLTIAWADGHFDEEEKSLIAELTHTELAPDLRLDTLEPLGKAWSETIDSAELAAAFPDSRSAENFLRTAVMVAIADGTYSAPEAEILQQFCVALQLDPTLLESLSLTLPQTVAAAEEAESECHLAPLRPVQEWLDELEIHDPQLARFLCKMIPPQCPFERDVKLFGRKIVHIPPLCKLNPLYEQLVGLRFRALSYLADDCGEDVTPYC